MQKVGVGLAIQVLTAILVIEIWPGIRPIAVDTTVVFAVMGLGFLFPLAIAAVGGVVWVKVDQPVFNWVGGFLFVVSVLFIGVLAPVVPYALAERPSGFSTGEQWTAYIALWAAFLVVAAFFIYGVHDERRKRRRLAKQRSSQAPLF